MKNFYNQQGFGETLRLNFGRDISTATAFELTLEPEVGDELTKTPTLGTSDVTEGDQTLLANQYVEYTIEEGAWDTYAGRWRAKAVATLPSQTLSTEYILFRVTE